MRSVLVRLGYTAIGEQVGLAQRMESVAPPGGVMLSESTARLVERAAVLGEPQMAAIKGASAPVPVRQLLGVAAHPGRIGRSETTLVGRQWEMDRLVGFLGSIDRRPGLCRLCDRAGGHREESAH